MQEIGLSNLLMQQGGLSNLLTHDGMQPDLASELGLQMSLAPATSLSDQLLASVIQASERDAVISTMLEMHNRQQQNAAASLPSPLLSAAATLPGVSNLLLPETTEGTNKKQRRLC